MHTEIKWLQFALSTAFIFFYVDHIIRVKNTMKRVRGVLIRVTEALTLYKYDIFMSTRFPLRDV